ncbi:MAG TPA: LysM peptidoglycan-binding domain-containing protein [Longilinea sp.]|nr:LysM peptidoglycan-binding domain-containing protein [Longilinea sp.]
MKNQQEFSINFRKMVITLVMLTMVVSACSSDLTSLPPPGVEESLLSATATVQPTPLPTRETFSPGQLVDYIAQTGDTLPAIAAHFNTTEEEIRAANTFIPTQVTTMPPGMPMQIPIYYESLWGSAYQIIPDSLFINGPAQIDFDVESFVNDQPGWLKSYREYSANEWRTGGQIVDYIATTFSISPRLLLALLEYQGQALTNPEQPDTNYILGYQDPYHSGMYLQLVWAANALNNGYYGWRSGELTEFEMTDGQLTRPDPWQNAATVGIQYYFAQLFNQQDFLGATLSTGLSAAYQRLFGDPWVSVEPHIPGSLYQPVLDLPFSAGAFWAFTGGPHTGWGTGAPYAALDFAPPSVVGGCTDTEEWATAVGDGVIVRRDAAIAVLDLDGDGDEHTGWVIFYLHLATDSIPAVGTVMHAGDPIGHPSCEGGRSTGTHVHIARKYNGEWILADSPLAFNLQGWIAHNGTEAYAGTLTRYSEVVVACVCSDSESQLEAQP